MPLQIQAGYMDYERLSVLIPFHLDLCPLQPQNASAFSLNQVEVEFNHHGSHSTLSGTESSLQTLQLTSKDPPADL